MAKEPPDIDEDCMIVDDQSDAAVVCVEDDGVSLVQGGGGGGGGGGRRRGEGSGRGGGGGGVLWHPAAPFIALVTDFGQQVQCLPVRHGPCVNTVHLHNK